MPSNPQGSALQLHSAFQPSNDPTNPIPILKLSAFIPPLTIIKNALSILKKSHTELQRALQQYAPTIRKPNNRSVSFTVIGEQLVRLRTVLTKIRRLFDNQVKLYRDVLKYDYDLSWNKSVIVPRLQVEWQQARLAKKLGKMEVDVEEMENTRVWFLLGLVGRLGATENEIRQALAQRVRAMKQ